MSHNEILKTSKDVSIMSTVGYARVSSVGQSLAVQLGNLEPFGCEKIYSEKTSGTTATRPELKKSLDYVR